MIRKTSTSIGVSEPSRASSETEFVDLQSSA